MEEEEEEEDGSVALAEALPRGGPRRAATPSGAMDQPWVPAPPSLKARPKCRPRAPAPGGSDEPDDGEIPRAALRPWRRVGRPFSEVLARHQQILEGDAAAARPGLPGQARARAAGPIGAHPALAPVLSTAPARKRKGPWMSKAAPALAPQRRRRKGGGRDGVRPRAESQGDGPIRLASKVPDGGGPAARKRRLTGGARAQGRKFAFVTVLWAPEDGNPQEYIVNALSLGCSLRKTNTKHDLVLLATPDLLRHDSARALSTYWDVRQQDHMEVPFEMRCAPRFRHVFTKLSVMQLTEYEKVLMLDADMLVIRNVDEIFGFPAPAGFMRGSEDYRPAEIRLPQTFRVDGGRLIGGINAGVVLLEPAPGIYDKMIEELASPAMKSDLKNSRGPEQDFLTLFYKSSWSGLHPKYNFQLHQILLNPWGERMRICWDDICILHFSAELKPSSFWLQDVPDYSKWLRKLLDSHAPKTGAAGKSIHAAYDRVNRAVMAWIDYWKEAWQGLVDGFPENMVQSRLQKCLLCSAHGPVDSQHCFLECPCVQDVAEAFTAVCQKHRLDPAQLLQSAPRGALVRPALDHFGAIFHRFCIDPSTAPDLRGTAGPPRLGAGRRGPAASSRREPAPLGAAAAARARAPAAPLGRSVALGGEKPADSSGFTAAQYHHEPAGTVAVVPGSFGAIQQEPAGLSAFTDAHDHHHETTGSLAVVPRSFGVIQKGMVARVVAVAAPAPRGAAVAEPLYVRRLLDFAATASQQQDFAAVACQQQNHAVDPVPGDGGPLPPADAAGAGARHQKQQAHRFDVRPGGPPPLAWQLAAPEPPRVPASSTTRITMTTTTADAMRGGALRGPFGTALVRGLRRARVALPGGAASALGATREGRLLRPKRRLAGRTSEIDHSTGAS